MPPPKGSDLLSGLGLGDVDSGDAELEDDDADTDDMALDMIAGDMLAAFESGDRRALKSALSALLASVRE